MTARGRARYWPSMVLVLAFALCAPTAEALDRRAADSPATTVRVAALVLTVPQGFNRDELRRAGRVGVLLTNYPVRSNSPTLAKGQFPPHGVALVVSQAFGPLSLLRRVPAPPLRIPLSLNRLQGPQHHPDGDAWNGTFRFRGDVYDISFWIGRTAPSRDQAAIRHALILIRSAA